MPDRLRSFFLLCGEGGNGVHAGVWEKIADALFWLQLFWVFSGFVLMAYLAFKVFPNESKSSNSDSEQRPSRMGSSLSDHEIPNYRAESGHASTLMVVGNYRLESFPQRATPANVIKFRTTISEQNRRMS